MKACPFCGSDRVELIDKNNGGMAGSIVSSAYVKCKNCQACGPRYDDWGNINYTADATTAWETRT